MIAIMRIDLRVVAPFILPAAFVACGGAPATTGGATDLQAFLDNADTTLLRLSNEANQAGWTQATYITPDTEAISARATEAFTNAVTDFAKRAATFDTRNATGKLEAVGANVQRL